MPIERTEAGRRRNDLSAATVRFDRGGQKTTRPMRIDTATKTTWA